MNTVASIAECTNLLACRTCTGVLAMSLENIQGEPEKWPLRCTGCTANLGDSLQPKRKEIAPQFFDIDISKIYVDAPHGGFDQLDRKHTG